MHCLWWRKRRALDICAGLLDLIKEQIEEALRPLVGLPLESSGRAGLQWFSFGAVRLVGDYRRGKKAKREVGEYALHIQCQWRLLGPAGIIVGSDDKYYPAGDPYFDDSDFDDDLPGGNRRDERVAHFFAERTSDSLVVETVSADHTGAIYLRMSGGFSLEVVPCHTLKYELWRLFRPATDEEHFVVTGLGIED